MDKVQVYYKVRCDQCQAYAISQYHATHENECPNADLQWVYDDETMECRPAEIDQDETAKDCEC